MYPTREDTDASSISTRLSPPANLLKAGKKRRLSQQPEGECLKRTTPLIDRAEHGVPCKQCQRLCKNTYSLNRHTRDKHGSSSILLCDQCPKSFTRNDTLLRHQRTQHGNGKIPCPKCGSPVRRDGMSEHLQSKVCRQSRTSLSANEDGPNIQLHAKVSNNKVDVVSESVVEAALASTVEPLGATGVITSPHPTSTSSKDNAWKSYAEVVRGERSCSEVLSERSINATPVVHSDDKLSEDLNEIDRGDTSEYTIEFSESEDRTSMHNVGSNSRKTYAQVAAGFSPPRALETEVSIRDSQREPMIVPDSPRIVPPKGSLDMVLLDCDAEIERLAKDVDDTRLDLTAAGMFKIRPVTAESKFNFLNTRRESRRFYRMRFGSQCALCQMKLGSTTENVFQHAKSHFQRREELKLHCLTCGVLFAYEVDLQLHASKQEMWSFCRGQPVEQDDTDSWLHKADANDRRIFVDLLRRWESLQLLWYLRAVRTLLVSQHTRKAKSKSIKTTPSSRHRKPKPPKTIYTATDMSLENDERTCDNDLCIETLKEMFSRSCFVEGAMEEVPEISAPSPREVRQILGHRMAGANPDTMWSAFNGALEEVRLRCANDQSHALSLGIMLNAAATSPWGCNLFFQRLVNLGAEPNTVDDMGFSTLIHAISNKHNGLAVMLIEAGADIHFKLRNGDSALGLAVDERLSDVVVALLRYGAEVDGQCPSREFRLFSSPPNTDDYETPLMLLSQQFAHGRTNTVETIEALLRGAPDIQPLQYLNPAVRKTLKNTLGKDRRPLTSRETVQARIATTLLECGADIDRQNNHGRTALVLALRSCRADVVEVLLSRGADTSIKDKEGLGVLQWMANLTDPDIRWGKV